MPQVWLRAANFSFATGHNQKALSQYARVLKITPVHAPAVFSYYGLMGLPLEEILGRGIPADRSVAPSYFEGRLGAGSDQDVAQAWRWVMSRSSADDQLAGRYVETLLHSAASPRRPNYGWWKEEVGAVVAHGMEQHLWQNHILFKDYLDQVKHVSQKVKLASGKPLQEPPST